MHFITASGAEDVFLYVASHEVRAQVVGKVIQSNQCWARAQAASEDVVEAYDGSKRCYSLRSVDCVERLFGLAAHLIYLN
jgi:hypothetical protein